MLDFFRFFFSWISRFSLTSSQINRTHWTNSTEDFLRKTSRKGGTENYPPFFVSFDQLLTPPFLFFFAASTKIFAASVWKFWKTHQIKYMKHIFFLFLILFKKQENYSYYRLITGIIFIFNVKTQWDLIVVWIIIFSP